MRVSSGIWTWFLTNGEAARLVAALASVWCFLLPASAPLDGLHLSLLSLALAPMFLSAGLVRTAIVAIVAWKALGGDRNGATEPFLLFRTGMATAKAQGRREPRRGRRHRKLVNAKLRWPRFVFYRS